MNWPKCKTEQYELAKVQEAKETPSVKILDPAILPERKSYPPRLLMMFLGTLLGTVVCVTWVLGAAHWNDFDEQDPRKVLAQEVAGTIKKQMPWASQNGNAANSRMQRVWDKLSRRPPASGSTDQ